jgi:hypothetical protein
LLQHDLQTNEVSVTMEFQGNLPEVHLEARFRSILHDQVRRNGIGLAVVLWSGTTGANCGWSSRTPMAPCLRSQYQSPDNVRSSRCMRNNGHRCEHDLSGGPGNGRSEIRSRGHRDLIYLNTESDGKYALWHIGSTGRRELCSDLLLLRGSSCRLQRRRKA